MSQQNFPLHNASSDLEKVAIKRFRSLVPNLPQECKVFRELWDRSTVLCLDFINCPESLAAMQEQSMLLVLSAHYLGLADTLLFKVGKKVKGWKTLSSKT